LVVASAETVAVQSYQDLVAWQKAIDLVEAVYRVTQGFPREELYGLTNQLRRAAVSIPSNVAEGQGRGAGSDFARYLRIANGSRQEVETQLLIGLRLGYLDAHTLGPLLAMSGEVGRLLSGLMKSIME
jgi:four helix bundle protein